jgi:hypothetical protein
LRRCLRADNEEPERIQEMVVVLRNGIKDFIGTTDGFEVLQGPDFIEPEVAART